MGFFHRCIHDIYVLITKEKQSGFMLIELTIVSALLAIMIGVAAVNLSFFQSAVMRSEVDKLHAACMHLQRCAQVSNKTHMLHFDVVNRSYSYGGYTVQLPLGISFGV